MIPDHFVRNLEPIIKKAGQILLSYFQTDLTRIIKQDGFATQADLASERYLIEALTPLVPGAAFLAEESGAQGAHDYCWVIDPLDGTNNFARGLPYFCISVALTYQGKPVVGAIYQPLLNEFFWAQRGNGAFLNGKPIKVSDLPDGHKGMVLVGLPSTPGSVYTKLLKDFSGGALPSYSVRQFGAAALDAAYVACGRVDGAFFEDLAWWDIAAGSLLIEEAGGKVTDFEGKRVAHGSLTFMGAGPRLYARVENSLKM